MAPVEKYVHQEYPKHVHKFGGLHLEVKSDAERDAALNAGWSLKPVLVEGAVDSKPVGAALDLSKMSKAQLIQHAKDVHGVDLDATQKKEALLAVITELPQVKAAEKV